MIVNWMLPRRTAKQIPVTQFIKKPSVCAENRRSQQPYRIVLQAQLGNRSKLRISHPQVPYARVIPLNVKDSKKPTQKESGKKPAQEKKQPKQMVNRKGKSKEASRETIDTEHKGTLRIKEKKKSSAANTGIRPQIKPITQKNARMNLDGMVQRMDVPEQKRAIKIPSPLRKKKIKHAYGKRKGVSDKWIIAQQI